MSKISTALLFATLFLTPALDALWAQTQQAAPTSPAPTNSARIETQLSKTIAFITVIAKWPDKDGKPGERVKISGTGFWVSVPDTRFPDKSFQYLVTNRHVAMAIEKDEEGNCTHLEIQGMLVTINLKDPINGNRSATVPLVLSEKFHWYFPKVEAIDLAVIPLGPSDKADAISIQSELFLTSEVLESKHVVPGDRVMTTGFYSGYAGMHGIQPIFREGILAMLPDGPMTMACGGSSNVYLADIHIIPGNSGSPILILPALPLGSSVSFGGIQNTFGLLGVVSGYMYENADLTLTAAMTQKGTVYANSGISIVVPAQQLKDLLESPELQGQRDEEVKRESKGGP